MTGFWEQVVGQDHATDQLDRAAVAPVHAYLFVGPPGSTKEAAARAFAARLLSDDPTSRAARLALAGQHPDVVEVQREGASILIEAAREIVRLSARSPSEGNRKVLILHEFHLVAPPAAAVLLKTIEEPPPSTVFIVLADQTPPELVTIASRCVRIDFRPIDTDLLERVLLAEGADPALAAGAAAVAHGDIDRARLLAADPQLMVRRDAFASVPRRLDGNGATAVALVEELLGLIEAAGAPLAARQAAEVAALEERVAALGERGSGRGQLTERHKREMRRHRADELRAGLLEIASTYRNALVENPGHRPDALVGAIHRVHAAMAALDRNPNEPLLLQDLLLHLPGLG